MSMSDHVCTQCRLMRIWTIWICLKLARRELKWGTIIVNRSERKLVAIFFSTLVISGNFEQAKPIFLADHTIASQFYSVPLQGSF